MHRVLIVGAGATGSAAALRLRQLGNVQLEVWEKARGPGAAGFKDSEIQNQGWLAYSKVNELNMHTISY